MQVSTTWVTTCPETVHQEDWAMATSSMLKCVDTWTRGLRDIHVRADVDVHDCNECLHGLAPKYMYLAELCVPVADVAGRRQLRSASRRLLNFPRYNVSNYGRRAFCFAGPHVWNSLPEHIRQSTSIAVFKRSLKTFLLQQISHLAH